MNTGTILSLLIVDCADFFYLKWYFFVSLQPKVILRAWKYRKEVGGMALGRRSTDG